MWVDCRVHVLYAQCPTTGHGLQKSCELKAAWNLLLCVSQSRSIVRHKQNINGILLRFSLSTLCKLLRWWQPTLSSSWWIFELVYLLFVSRLFGNRITNSYNEKECLCKIDVFFFLHCCWRAVLTFSSINATMSSNRFCSTILTWSIVRGVSCIIWSSCYSRVSRSFTRHTGSLVT